MWSRINNNLIVDKEIKIMDSQRFVQVGFWDGEKFINSITKKEIIKAARIWY